MDALTPFQTVGPYLRLGFVTTLGRMTRPGGGAPIVVTGRLLDGAGAGVPDGVLEFWAPGFDAIGRALTEADGTYRLDAQRPEAHGGGAPHFAVRVLARGVLTECVTRVYFADDPATAADPVLRLVPEARRSTLLAQPGADAAYHLDVILQGAGETVFFDL